MSVQYAWFLNKSQKGASQLKVRLSAIEPEKYNRIY